MTTVNINNTSPLNVSSGGQVLVSSGTYTTLDSSIKIDKNLVEYIDLLYQIMGVDITYDRWKNMSSGEKLQLIRDIKLKKIIEE